MGNLPSNYRGRDKYKVLKNILIIVLLSADIGRATGIMNTSFYVTIIITTILIISSNFTNQMNKFKYLKPELTVYSAIFIIALFIILYLVEIKNIIHVLKLFLIFYIVYPAIRSFFSFEQIITTLKINLIINFVLIILGMMGVEMASKLTGISRGSTLLNYAGSLYKVGVILIPYLIWEIVSSNKSRIVNIVLLLISIYVILFDGSRTGIISVMLIFFLYTFIGLIILLRGAKISFNLFMKNIILFLIMVILAVKGYGKIIQSNAYTRGQEVIKLFLNLNMSEFLAKGDMIRGQMILDAIERIKSNYLILGKGFESTTTNGMVIHNAYLQVFADLGLIPAICLITMLVYPIFIGFKNIRSNKDVIPSAISVIIFSFSLLLHPFSVQVSDWAFYIIPVSLMINSINTEKQNNLID